MTCVRCRSRSDNSSATADADIRSVLGGMIKSSEGICRSPVLASSFDFTLISTPPGGDSSPARGVRFEHC